MVNVTLIGTGGMLPLPYRWLTSLWVEYQGHACLTDCGEGTQIAIKQHGLKLSHLDTILITHTHADHISGLPGLLLSLGNCGKTDTLRIYGHTGISQTIEKLMCICPFLPFPVEVCELPVSECAELDWNGMKIRTIPLEHSVECLGYSFTLERKPVFDPQKARSLGIDVKYWKTLHAGGTVDIDGKTFTTDMVTGEKRAPIKVTYITDTMYFDGLVDFARGSDLLVCEGMYGDDEYIGKMEDKGHMVFSQSASVAADSGSARLWLTHYSPALTAPEDYADSVKKIFPNTTISRDGENTELN